MSDIFGNISIDHETPQKNPKKPPPHAQLPRNKKKDGRQKSNSNKFLWFLIPTLIFVGYSLLGFLGLPYYLTSSIPQQLQLRYNLNLTVEKTHFNPYTFTLQLENTSVTQKDDQQLIDVENINIVFSPIELLRMEFVCQKVIFSSPSLHLKRNKDHSYNISPLIEGVNHNRENPQMMGFSDLPFLFSFNNIIITDGSIVFDDRPAGKTHYIEQLQLQLPTLSNIGFQADDYIRPHFSANINGSPVTFKEKESSYGTSSQEKPAEMIWEMEGFKLQEYMNYLPFDLPFVTKNGVAEGTIALQFNNQKEQLNKLKFSFHLDITDFACNTEENALKLTSKKVVIKGAYNPIKHLITISKLHLSEPVFSSNTDKTKEVVSNLLWEKDKPGQLQPANQKTYLHLHSFDFADGVFRQNHTNSSSPLQEWTNINVKIDNFVSDGRFIKADSNQSLFLISGQQTDKSNKFIYSGTFKSAQELSGDLTVEQLSSKDLLLALLPVSENIQSSGIAKFKSILTCTRDKESGHIDYVLTDINTTVKDLKIVKENITIVSADEVHMAKGATSKEKNKLGEVTIKGGYLHINRHQTNHFYTQFVSQKDLLSSLRFDGDIVIASDKAPEDFLNLSDVKLEYETYGISTETNNNISLTANTNTGGSIGGAGTFKLAPFELIFSLDFSDIPTTKISAFFSKPHVLASASGQISGKGVLGLPTPSFTGDLSVKNGNSKIAGTHLSWEICAIENLNFTSKPYHVGIGHIQLQQPISTISIANNSSSIPETITNFLRTTLIGRQHDSKKENSVKISETEIQNITIDGGQISIIDNRVSPPWKASVKDLQGQINDIRSARSAPNSTFNFKGNIDSTAFTWDGNLSPFKNSQTETYNLSMHNYPLKDFGAQLQRLSEVDPNLSTITLDLQSSWNNGLHNQEISSEIFNLMPSSQTSDTALPIALLSNKNNTINLNLSTESSTFSSNLSLFENLVNNFQKQVVKGGHSPLLLAKGDFTDLIDNEYLDFKPGQFMFSENGRKTLTRFGALLIAHPNIKLALSGGVSLEKDLSGMRAQLEKDENLRVEKENRKLFAKWQKKKQEFEGQRDINQDTALSKGVISESDIPTKVLSGFRPLLPETVVVDNEMLFDLAEKRLSIVRNHFITQLSLDEDRIKIVTQTMEDLTHTNEGKGVHIEILPMQ